MILMLDTMSQRYGLLPSETMDRASTFDLVILEAAISYENFQRAKAEGKLHELNHDENELLKVWEKRNG